MALHDNVSELRRRRVERDGCAVPNALQGVTKERIRVVLERFGLANNSDLVDGVFALLDNETCSWFAAAPTGATFSDGATTAHLACHIGILQRGRSKLDREGRDYWIKPLRDLGAIEPVLLYQGRYLAGHPVPKSPNSAYRLAESFKDILRAPEDRWASILDEWVRADSVRARRDFQAQVEQEARQLVDGGHRDLIRVSIEHYARRFLPEYEVLYVDDADGDRISADARERLQRAGVEIGLGDAMPDVLLWNARTDRLWVIEAVTSDGEVDNHKVQQLRDLATRSGKAGIDFTTTYRTWKDLAARQSAHHNIAVNTYIWVQSDASRTFYVSSYI